jgi:hypothetical protein
VTNATQIIWEHLSGALTGTNVWSPAAPASWANDSAAVVFEVVSEDAPMPGGGHVGATVAVTCYGGGATHAAADAVYRAVHDALHGVRGAVTASGTLHYAAQQKGAPGGEELETRWPMATATYRILVGA